MKKETILVWKKEVYSKSHKSKEIYYEFKTALGRFNHKVFIMGNFKGCVSDKEYHQTKIDNIHEDALYWFKDSEVYPSEENFRMRKEEEEEKEREKKERKDFFCNITERIKKYNLTQKDGQPREVVFYNTFGGFNLSEKTISCYALLKYGEEAIDNLDEILNLETSHLELKSGKYIASWDIPRHDPILIALVKEIEIKDNNRTALEICKVDGKYFISQYDGRERVHDMKNLKRKYGWCDVVEEDFKKPKEVEIVKADGYFFWLKNETMCRYALERYAHSEIKNIDKIKSFETSKIELNDGKIIKEDTISRHDPLFVKLVKEIEIEKFKNENEFSIEKTIYPYWINNDSDYPERIISCKDLCWI